MPTHLIVHDICNDFADGLFVPHLDSACTPRRDHPANASTGAGAEADGRRRVVREGHRAMTVARARPVRADRCGGAGQGILLQHCSRLGA